MNQLFFPLEDLRAIISRMEAILKYLAKKQNLSEDEAVPYFVYEGNPWIDNSTGQLIVINGGLKSLTGDFLYLDLKVKVVGDKLCFWVKSDGKINNKRFYFQTKPGDISDKSLIEFLESVYGLDKVNF
jgi:hypothetical protein